MARVHSVQVSPNDVNKTLKSFSDLGWSFVSQSTVQAGSTGMMVANPFAPGTMVGGMRSNTSIMLFFSHEDDKALTPDEKTFKIRQQAQIDKVQKAKQEKELLAIAERKIKEDLQAIKEKEMLEEQQRIYDRLEREKREEDEREKALIKERELRDSNLRKNLFNTIHSEGYAAWLIGSMNLESGILEISDEDFTWCASCTASQDSEIPCDCWRDNENFIRFRMPLGKGNYSVLRIVKDYDPTIAIGGLILLAPATSKKIADSIIDEGRSRLLNLQTDFRFIEGPIEYVGSVQNYIDEDEDIEDFWYFLTVGDALADRSGWFARLNLHLAPGEYALFTLNAMSMLLILNIDEISKFGLSKDLSKSNSNVTWDKAISNQKIKINPTSLKTVLGSNIAMTYDTDTKGESHFEFGAVNGDYYSWLLQYNHVFHDNSDVDVAIKDLKALFHTEEDAESFLEVSAELRHFQLK